jgi:hypothetical protein
MEETLRALVAVGLGGLLVLLRLDAERFGAAEYDEEVDGIRPPLRRRLAWYLVGVALILAIVFIHPAAEGELGLGLGDRSTALLAGFAYGALGLAQALAFAFVRYRRIRFPDFASYPTALVNSLLTAFIDEAIFRGVVLGALLLVGVEPWLAIILETLLYALATRTGAPGRPPYMLALAVGIGLVGGWLTVETGSIGAAFIGHAITRFSVFLTTGHAGHVRPAGTEDEEILKRRLTPDGWRVIGGREGREASPPEP